jgi:diguanylate cyclase (GGDEF)-like protein
VVRTLALATFALATSIITRSWELPLYVIAVAIPYNGAAAWLHRRHDRPSIVLAADQVLASVALLIDERALAGVVIVQLQSAVMSTLALGTRTTRIASAVTTVIGLAAAVINGDTTVGVFMVASLLSAVALSNFVDYLLRRQRGIEGRMVGVLDGIDVLVYEADLVTSEVLYANRAMRDILGGRPFAKLADAHSIVHPDDIELSRQSVQSALRTGEVVTSLLRVTLADGVHIFEQRMSTERSARGRARLRTVLLDITEQHQLRESLRELALHDPLTGVANRLLLADHLEHAIAVQARTGRTFALMVIDLDGFKVVNDLHGHHSGDELLRVIAGRLREQVRDVDTVARLGGDEFAVLLVDADQHAAEEVAARLIEAIARVHRYDGVDLAVTASLGVSMYPADATTIDQLMRNADAVMYNVKVTGNAWGLFGARRD